METLTLSQIEDRYETTRKAIARRVERGSVRSLLDAQGRRVIPVVELERVGLQPRRGTPEGSSGGGAAPGQPRGDSLELVPLLDRLERLVAENARLRLLTEQAESLQESERDARLRLEAEVKELRAQLESRPRRWWRRPREFAPVKSAGIA